MEWFDKGPDKIGYTERDFKVCDLCGALNPAANTDCFVCGWHGAFHTDRETVRDAMQELEYEQGGIDETLFYEQVVPSTPPRPGFWTGLWGVVKKIFSRD